MTESGHGPAAAAAAAAELGRLEDEYFATAHEVDPLGATQLGVTGFDDLLPDPSRAGAADGARRIGAIERQLADVDPGLLDEAGRTSHAVLAHLRAARRRDGPVHLGPAAARHAVVRRPARVPARRGHRHAPLRLAALARDRVHVGQHRHLAVQRDHEVDRYIGWPGQALAYMIGRREIRRLRDRAARDLGARFDIRAFHGAVLGSGAVPLGVLDQIVTRWTAGARAGAQPG